MQVYPKLLLTYEPASLPGGFRPSDITPNWSGVQREWRQTFRSQDGWGATTFRDKPGFFQGSDNQWRIKIVATTATDAPGADHASVVADIDASTLKADIKQAVRDALPAGVVLVRWDWSIKTLIGGVSDRTEQSEVE